MKDLIKYDFQRMLKDKLIIVTFVITLGLAVASPLLFVLIQVLANYENSEPHAVFGVATTFWASFSFSPIGLLLTIFMSIINHKDIGEGTIRNKLVMGKTRSQIYISNTIVFLTIYLSLVLIALIVGTMTGFLWFQVVFGYGWAETIHIGYFFMAFFQTLFAWVAVITLANLFSFALDKMALGILIPILLASVTSIAMMVLSASLISVFQGDTEKAMRVYYIVDAFDYFTSLDWTLNSTYSATPSVIVESIMSKDKFNIAYTAIIKLLMPVCFSVLNFFLGYIAINKRDFK